MRLQLVGGSYSSRSIIASAQRCINYYPEINRKDAIVPMTYYQRPGLVPVCQVGSGPIRALYLANNGFGYVVSGSYLYQILPDWTTVQLGQLTPMKTNPVSMTDNGLSGQMVVVDGSTQSWQVDLATQTFSIINDPTGSFTGADKVDFIDGFILWNEPKSPFFGSSLDFQVAFNPEYFFGKTDYADNVQTIIVNRHEVIVLGVLTSEVWYDAGTLPPFAELPGSFINHGTPAKYSVAQQDIAVYWLAQNREGSGQVLRLRGYLTERISNHALEMAIQQMRATSTISDAIGYCYQLDGHVFYVLHFPSGDQTWVYDEAVGDPHMAWHQEAWTDANGVLHRHRGNCHAFINGVNVVGDWQNGTIYQMSLDAYVDTVNGVDGPITCVRTFPHIAGARTVQGQLADVDGKRLQFSAFRADIECGMGPTTIGMLPAQISLRWSDDRGRTFGNDLLQSNGQPGEYLTQPQWLGIGIARDRIFEISHAIAGPAALNGAWIDAEVLST